MGREGRLITLVVGACSAMCSCLLGQRWARYASGSRAAFLRFDARAADRQRFGLAAEQSIGQQLYEETKPEAESACAGRNLKPGELIELDAKTAMCVDLLSWSFDSCEQKALKRYPEYQETVLGCVRRSHDDLISCCTRGGPNGSEANGCNVRALDACADAMNKRFDFCPVLSEFVVQGIVAEANDCVQDLGFDSIGSGARLPPVCGARAVCIAKHTRDEGR
jgi:hypothetical protein